MTKIREEHLVNVPDQEVERVMRLFALDDPISVKQVKQRDGQWTVVAQFAERVDTEEGTYAADAFRR